MNNFSFQKVAHVAAAVLVASALLACATITHAEDGKQEDRWHFAVIPCVWVPRVNMYVTGGN